MIIYLKIIYFFDGHAKFRKKMCRNWKILSRKVTIPKFKKCDNVPKSHNPEMHRKS